MNPLDEKLEEFLNGVKDASDAVIRDRVIRTEGNLEVKAGIEVQSRKPRSRANCDGARRDDWKALLVTNPSGAMSRSWPLFLKAR